MTIKPRWDSKSAGEYERSLTLRDTKVEDDDDIQDYKKPWVGLTDEEQMALLKDSDGKTRHWLVWQVEAKCKEKNT